MLLPVTPAYQRGPGHWGSPFARPRRIDLRCYPRGCAIPKGVWMIKCGPNQVDLVWQEDDFFDEPRRAPGTGLILRPACPPERPWWAYSGPFGQHAPRFGHNRTHRENLIRSNSTGTVFADGFSVVLSGVGEATAIRIFG